MDFTTNRICKLLQIEYPVIQGGMVWASGAKLASAVANQGCLGLIGAASMKPPLLREHIRKARQLHTASGGQVGVNIPLLYHMAGEQIEVALEEGIRIFFTSAGSPKTYTKKLKDEGACVVHVTSSPLLARKCEDAGVDAVVAEGFEAGGHNGREEIASMALIPQVCDAVSIAVIAAGGICDGRQMAASLCLGAEGVQIGTAFAATIESSLHPDFKAAIIGAGFGDTRLSLKKHIPVRLLENAFARRVQKMEAAGASREELEAELGSGRARKGMFEGDLEEGELEIGQVSAMVKHIPSVCEYVQNLISQFERVGQKFHPKSENGGKNARG